MSAFSVMCAGIKLCPCVPVDMGLFCSLLCNYCVAQVMAYCQWSLNLCFMKENETPPPLGGLLGKITLNPSNAS